VSILLALALIKLLVMDWSLSLASDGNAPCMMVESSVSGVTTRSVPSARGLDEASGDASILVLLELDSGGEIWRWSTTTVRAIGISVASSGGFNLAVTGESFFGDSFSVWMRMGSGFVGAVTMGRKLLGSSRSAGVKVASVSMLSALTITGLVSWRSAGGRTAAGTSGLAICKSLNRFR
jgi:hypothetical protein